MRALRHPLWLVLAVVLYCAWQSRALLGTWKDAPLDRLGWLALLLWVAPLAWSCWTARAAADEPSHLLVALAVGLAFVGSVGAVNALRYAGLACALAAARPWRWRQLPWLLAAISWMPAFGYFVSSLSPALVLPGRIALATAAAVWFWYGGRNDSTALPSRS